MRLDEALDHSRQIARNKHNEEVMKNRKGMRTLIEITCFLGTHGLAFRGHYECSDSTNRGNYNDLCTLIAARDPAFQDFINNKVFSGTSGGIQNELIECIESYMLQTIKREVLDAEFVSIMMDESTDSARLSQLSCTLRYLRPDGTPVERLVRLADVSSDKTAAALAGHVDEIAAYFGLDGDKVVAQSYDGAAVMSGDKSGVQTLVKQRFPKAGYIHCRAHVLNLVLLHSCTNNKKSARFFNTISSLAAFFSQSPKRSETLKQFMETHIPNACKTKWSYNSRMIKIIDSNYAAINECLDVLYQILQTKELDVVECLRNVKACLASIEELKAEHHFYRTLNDAIDVSGETITDSNGINYRPIYDFIIDKIIDEMSKRFKELDEYKFIILLNHEKIAEFNVTFPTKNLKMLISYHSKFDEAKLYNELTVLYSREEFRGKNILYLISFILGQNLHQTFSETLRLARMILTLPNTTASVERTFSVLRRIKNYLRSESAQNRLFGIMVMAVEKDLLHEMMLTPLFYDDIIDKFALKVNRRIPLL
ncbi:zinc finger MYM-type protein 1-like [Wyeomyia smithii]|uniref:zinc finger MYM-type protein 1-like n=1 Tax=Wyeomyia smithii TaxID=174621 RepID=UPI002467E0D3|nr:zinc finger MYM-type protein 1-like [Wyeomyia smithii]